MKLFNLLLPLVLVVIGVAALRYQFFNVVEKETTPSEGGLSGLNIGTPVITPLCGFAGKPCNFPGMTLYGSPTPRRGIPAPSGFEAKPGR